MRKPGQFRDVTALEVLRGGEMEAMEKLAAAAGLLDGFAQGIDARLAAIEARLKALEEANAAVSGGARVGGLVQATPREADQLELPPDRHAEGGAVETGGEVSLPAGGGTPPQRDDG
jgi:hypothetical protein